MTNDQRLELLQQGFRLYRHYMQQSRQEQPPSPFGAPAGPQPQQHPAAAGAPPPRSPQPTGGFGGPQ